MRPGQGTKTILLEKSAWCACHFRDTISYTHSFGPSLNDNILNKESASGITMHLGVDHTTWIEALVICFELLSHQNLSWWILWMRPICQRKCMECCFLDTISYTYFTHLMIISWTRVDFQIHYTPWSWSYNMDRGTGYLFRIVITSKLENQCTSASYWLFS